VQEKSAEEAAVALRRGLEPKRLVEERNPEEPPYSLTTDNVAGPRRRFIRSGNPATCDPNHASSRNVFLRLRPSSTSGGQVGTEREAASVAYQGVSTAAEKG
jgi:hypothetical protein